MPTVGSSLVAATRQPTSPSPQPTSTSAHSTGPPTNQPTNHSTLQPTPFAPTNPTPTTNLPPTNSIPPTPPPVPSPATTQPNRNPASTHSMVTRYRVGTNRPTQRYTLSVSTISPIPKSYNHAFQDPHWYRAMLDEYNALIKNNTWILVPRPSDANIVRSLWLFRHKYNADGTLNRYRADLFANGSNSVYCMILMSSMLLYMVIIEGTVYMQQPPGFRDSQHSDHVCLLHRSLYGLKQAPLAWFQRFAVYAARVGFIHSRCDTSLFIYKRGSDTAYLFCMLMTIIIDGLIFRLIFRVLLPLYMQSFMTDWVDELFFGVFLLTAILGDVSFSYKKYALSYFERAGDAHCNPCRTSVDTDSKLLLMSSKRQVTLSRSSAEAEYRGVANAAAETCWLRNLLRELHTPLSTAKLVYYDNVSAVYLSSNPVQHQRTKHIEIDIHFVCDLVAAGHIRVIHVPSRYHYADIFTKGLPTVLFDEFCSSLSVRSSPAQTVEGC
ncbi:ribonuclease H-like domain-containing protein [Tanacetum coccineum]